MGLFGKKKNLVGLDIGSSSVKAVELKPGKGETWQLTTIGLEYLPQEAIVDGQIMDSTSVIDAIQQLFAECMGNHHCRCSIVNENLEGGASFAPPSICFRMA